MNSHRFHNVIRRLQHFKCRSAHSSAKPESEIEILTKQEPKLTQSRSGIVVASVENYKPLTQVSVVVKAGSRYEKPHNLGITHCLRNAAVLSTKNISSFGLVRNLELDGSKVDVTATREHLIYTVQCIRDEVDKNIELLAQLVTKPAFLQWELDDALHRMHTDLRFLEANNEAVLLEALHKAAFRGGLANSLYSPTFMIGKHNSEMLHAFFEENFIVSKTSVVGHGISHDHLQKVVDKLFKLNDASADSSVSKFAGGEMRLETDIPFVCTAIVAEGSGLLNVKDTLSLSLLQCIMGSPCTKYGGVGYSKLSEIASKNTENPFVVSSLNISYSDTGLFGVYISGSPNDMHKLVKSVVNQMREVAKNINEVTVQTAKHQLKAKLALERELPKNSLESMALDVSHLGKLRTISEIEKSIDEIQVSDVANVAARVMKTKPAMAAVGRLHSTPFLDELI